jgi:[acyl-carrier-protein] S-malonyltransferase
MYAGQGSQYVGMGLDIIEKYPHLMHVINSASKVLHEDILAWFSHPESFQNTYQTQLLTVITQELFDHVLHDITIDGVFGFSLGDMSALKRSGVINFETMLLLTQARARAMQKAAEVTEGMMAAVIKLTSDVIEHICKTHSTPTSYMMPVNFNAPLQTVISGHKDAFEIIKDKLIEAGGKVLPLKVSGAFHTPLMSSHQDIYENVIDQISFKQPHMSLFSNVTGQPISSIVKEDLIKQMTSPVRLTDIFKSLASSGYTHLIEIGPGNVLSQLASKQIETITIETYQNALSLEERK